MPRYRTPVDLARSVAQTPKKPPAPSLRTRAEARRARTADVPALALPLWLAAARYMAFAGLTVLAAASRYGPISPPTR